MIIHHQWIFVYFYCMVTSVLPRPQTNSGDAKSVLGLKRTPPHLPLMLHAGPSRWPPVKSGRPFNGWRNITWHHRIGGKWDKKPYFYGEIDRGTTPSPIRDDQLESILRRTLHYLWPFIELGNENDDGGDIVFPGSQKVTIRPNIDKKTYIPKVEGDQPKCANGNTFCLDVNNYPADHIRNLLRNSLDQQNSYFGKEEIEIDIKDRINEQTYTFCQSQVETIYPKMAQNKDDKWRFIINQDNHIQGVKIEKCFHEGPCNFSPNLPMGYETSCEQKYIYHKLLSINDNGDSVPDSFRLPSCCNCEIRAINTTGTTARIGLTRPNTSPVIPRTPSKK